MKQTFEFEWDEHELGRGWFNIYNLELLLFSQEHTLRNLVKVKEIKRKSLLGKIVMWLVMAIGIAILLVILYMLAFVGIIATGDFIRMVVFGG